METFKYAMETSSMLWGLLVHYGDFEYAMETSSTLWRLLVCYGGVYYAMENSVPIFVLSFAYPCSSSLFILKAQPDKLHIVAK